jgi:predicted ArsR family transcriptional regulator
MRLSDADDRLLQTTRGKILALLKRKERTVRELADELGLTDNGIRAHLTTLERDGFVRAAASRRSIRKPARVYGLVPEAEQRLSAAYPPVLIQLCSVLSDTLPKAERDQTMRTVGSRLAGTRRIPEGNGEARVRTAADAIEQLGGACDVIATEKGFSIQGHGCPLGLVTGDYPEACLAVEAMLSTMLGCQVQERCTRGERPSCRFDIAIQAS